jgi:hypothetical protein
LAPPREFLISVISLSWAVTLHIMYLIPLEHSFMHDFVRWHDFFLVTTIKTFTTFQRICKSWKLCTCMNEKNVLHSLSTYCCKSCCAFKEKLEQQFLQ